MTIVKPKPDDPMVALDLTTITDKAVLLWSECYWLCYGYGKPGPWVVRAEWHKTGDRTFVLQYTTNEEMADPNMGGGTNLELLVVKSTADFTDGGFAPTPTGDIVTIKIWKDA